MATLPANEHGLLTSLNQTYSPVIVVPDKCRNDRRLLTGTCKKGLIIDACHLRIELVLIKIIIRISKCEFRNSRENV
jgi:hypothetical protein